MHSSMLVVVTILIALMTVLLLLGCTTTQMITPTPAPQHPQVTLTVMALATPLPTSPTPPPAVALSQAMSDLSLGLVVEPPTCYELPEKQVWCLGRVFNYGTHALENVRLFFEADGRTLMTRLEQQVIHVGDFAPYRLALQGVVLAQPPRLVQQQARPSHSARSPLRLQALSGRYLADTQSYGRYELEMSVVNTSATPIYNARLIVTLLDASARVVGYRVVELADELNSNVRLPVLASIVPLALAESYTPLITLASDASPTNAPR